MSTCELYPLVQKTGLLRIWQMSYCMADYSRCARYQQSLAGKSVPVSLLPNGQTLNALAPKG